MIEGMTKENKKLKDKVASMEDLEQSTSINKDLKETLKEKDKELPKRLRGS